MVDDRVSDASSRHPPTDTPTLVENDDLRTRSGEFASGQQACDAGTHNHHPWS